MTLTRAQEIVLSHLRSAYVGPEGSESEVIYNPPNRQYAVGMLFPRDPEPQADNGATKHDRDEVDVDRMTAFDGEV